MLIEANKIPKNNIIWKYSDPKKSQKLAHKYFGKMLLFIGPLKKIKNI
jgi:hypothetical protein